MVKRRSGNMPFCYEESITDIFFSELKYCLGVANSKKRIEKAFCSDLKRCLPNAALDMPKKIADGLIADLTLHGRATERKSGGDFGLVISSPQISHKRFVDYPQGILCQAKRCNNKGKWGVLSENQEKIFSDVPDYLVLVLYSFLTDGSTLDSFRWQSCRGASLEKVKMWLKDDAFPNPICSNNIIEQLGRGQVGTDDQAVIRERISPENNPSLQIRICWPDGSEPKSKILMHALKRMNSSQNVVQRISS